MFDAYVRADGGTLDSWPKWLRILRAEADDEAACTEPSYLAWRRSVDALANGTTAKRQLQKINRAANRLRYQRDGDAFKKRDVWQSPREFLARGTGDCEDYAILKYFALRRLGFDPSLVLVSSDFGLHAVAVSDCEGDTWVLDNRLSIAVQADRLARIYRPKIGLNQDLWWRYRAPATAEALVS